jgi:hypothetical protein
MTDIVRPDPPALPDNIMTDIVRPDPPALPDNIMTDIMYNQKVIIIN